MEIKQIETTGIGIIRPLWEELNTLHAQSSTHFHEHFLHNTFEDRLRRFMANEKLAVFVAQNQEEVAGYCVACMNGGRGEIDSLFVRPDHRNKGLGLELLLRAESWLESRQAASISVRVMEGNEPVLGFYGKQGYLPRHRVLEKKP